MLRPMKWRSKSETKAVTQVLCPPSENEGCGRRWPEKVYWGASWQVYWRIWTSQEVGGFEVRRNQVIWKQQWRTWRKLSPPPALDINSCVEQFSLKDPKPWNYIHWRGRKGIRMVRGARRWRKFSETSKIHRNLWMPETQRTPFKGPK